MTPEQRLMQALADLGLTRQEFADRLGISLSAIAMYATGAHKIRRVVALAVQAQFGVSAEWLLTGAGKQYSVADKGKGLAAPALRAAELFAQIPAKDQPTAMRMLRGLAPQ